MLNIVFMALLLLTASIASIFLYRYLPRLPWRQRLSSSLSLVWYRQVRALASLSMLVMMVLALFVQSGLAEGTMQHLGISLNQMVMHAGADTTTLRLPSHTVPQTASMQLVRVDSAARDQYASAYEWQVWAYSSCSGIAMETVMNAYGRHLIASDVLQVEQDLGVWNVQLGLLRDDGVALTADHFGFNTSASHALTVEQVVEIANEGKPVIVSVRDSVNYPAGHIFVVRGGDAQTVFIVDSSLLNLHQLTRAQFSAMWQGFSAVLTPRGISK
ncbi:MAG TPA: hypothetical protein VL485_11210 [Ktedonobacteraceae bacterium]|jgi:hypothetical protein|nr:hypothetical protein [Ktedonobacteraceae bacterium]